ncbi:MAG: hypothetical protein AAGC46_00480 [Solirubrobacteraceae bacterium]
MNRFITPADDRYHHQIVAPSVIVEHQVPAWAERCYHVLYVGDDLMMNFGRAIYPYDNRRTALGCAYVPGAVHAVREAGVFTSGEDPDAGRLGPLAIECLDPLKTFSLTLDGDRDQFAYDLTFTARGAAVPTDRNIIELKGELVTDYMNFFQSGLYSGTVWVEGREYTVKDRAGFRDRGWGIRKHEGAPRRGFVLFAAVEFAETTLYLLLYEAASGRRAFTNGWLVGVDGIVDTVETIDHDLDVDAAKLVTGGSIDLGFTSGTTRKLTFDVDNRTFLKAGGYAADLATVPQGYSKYDLSDASVVAWLNGQNDNGCTATLDGEPGHGLIETGIGTHVRYDPEGAAS